MQFEFYVLNYDSNRRKVEMFNIFRNIIVQERTEKAVKKYLRSPKNFKYESYTNKEVIQGFDGLVKEIDRIIMCEEWSRSEYEVGVGYAHANNMDKFEKIDCYYQAHANAEIITHTVLRQYKEQLKKERE